MSQVVVALDGMDPATSLALAKTLSPLQEHGLWGFKIGHALTNQGGDWIQELRGWGKVFVDLKFHDIPNTVESAVRWLAQLQVDLATVHISMGRSTLERIAHQGVGILGVSLLTSTLPEECLRVYRASPQDTLQSLFAEVVGTGITGVVCSPQDLGLLQQADPQHQLLRVCPGIRRSQDSLGDQQRVATPQAAQAQGADLLVIGRPIVAQTDPKGAATSILQELQE